MTSNAVCGYTGTVTGLSGAGEVTKWELVLTVEDHDVTSMSSLGWEDYLGCVKKGEWTLDTLITMGPIGSITGTITLSNDLGSWSFKGIVEKISTKTDANDVVTFTYSGVTTGEVDESLAG
jgi:hypothetical protein